LGSKDALKTADWRSKIGDKKILDLDFFHSLEMLQK